MFKTPEISIDKEVWSVVSYLDETKGYWNCLKKYFNISDFLPLQLTIKDSVTAVSKALRYEADVDMTGYLMALNWIYADYESIDLTENNIDKMYNMVMNLPADSKAQKNYKPRKILKTQDDDFGSIFGSESIYEDEKPEQLVKDIIIRDLTQWIAREFKSSKLHPILVISIFCAEFLNLKAYPGANSRLSRLLAILLLLKNGYGYLQNTSLDDIIGKKYSAYEPAYLNVSHDDEIDYTLWNNAFLKILNCHAQAFKQAVEYFEPQIQAKEEDCPLCNLAENTPEVKDEPQEDDCPLCNLVQEEKTASECPLCELAEEEKDEKPAKTKTKKALKSNSIGKQAKKAVKIEKKSYKDLPELQIKIMKMFTKTDRVTISEAVKTTKGNLNTIKKHLASMVDKGLLEKHGKTRGAWYTSV